MSILKGESNWNQIRLWDYGVESETSTSLPIVLTWSPFYGLPIKNKLFKEEGTIRN